MNNHKHSTLFELVLVYVMAVEDQSFVYIDMLTVFKLIHNIFLFCQIYIYIFFAIPHCLRLPGIMFNMCAHTNLYYVEFYL